MTLLFCLALAATDLAATAVPEDDPRKELANTDEIRHAVSFKLVAPDAAAFTVTRDFQARSPAEPMRLDRQFGLPDESVVTSFAFRSDGTWREGRLGPADAPGKKKGAAVQGHAAGARPWVSLAGQNFQAIRLASPSFRGVGTVQIRYTVWAAAEITRGGRRWVYCGGDQNDGDKDEKVVPEIVLPPAHPELRVVPDAKSASCLVVEKTEPEAVAPTARFGTYRLGPHTWWWRLELAVPEKTVAASMPPEAAPILFVLDASRSQARNGGLAHQLAIVESTLANTPSAEVELVLVNRTAQRVFDRFVPAGGFKQALPPGLATRALGNGSSLDRGAELAIESLKATGKPGRIILMTDGGLRAGFRRDDVVAALRRAPAGTIVHVVYPDAGATTETIRHNVPEGLDEVATTFGGASYSVMVNRSSKNGAPRAPAPELLRTLIKPEAVESLGLYDASSPRASQWAEWPEALDGDQVAAGDGRVWSGVSETRPPAKLVLSGWVWARNLKLAIRPDPAFEQRLARLVQSEDDVMACEESTRPRKDALAQGFLAPDLAFRVPGDGAPEAPGSGSIAPTCGGGSGDSGSGDSGSGGGGGTAESQPPAQDIAPQLGNVLRRCGLVSDARGTIKLKVETHGAEILDVSMAGGEDWQRQCLEDGVWAVNLPAAFNQEHAQPVEYPLALAGKKAAATP